MKKLLIIEDEISVAKQIKWGFGKDYEITIAVDANQARSLLTAGVFPVVLLDLGLPPHPDSPQEGLRLLSEIGSLSSQTKVIVVTGHGEEEIAVQAVAAGAADLGIENTAIEPLEPKLPTLKQAREEAEVKTIQRALALTGNNISQAAALLSISRPTLHDLLKKHWIGQ